MLRKLLLATTTTLSLFCGASAMPAHAMPILGSHVEAQVFLDHVAANTDGWAYLGADLGPPSPFGIDGRLTLVGRSSSYLNSFGYSDVNHANRVEIFGANAGVGAMRELTAAASERLFYFGADGSDLLLASDDNLQYSDGFSSGGTPGRLQGGMDIFYHAPSHTWALFFDDAGGGLPIIGDDNDYDDLIVTFRRHLVPEPGSLSLLGLALVGIAGIARRKKS